MKVGKWRAAAGTTLTNVCRLFGFHVLQIFLGEAFFGDAPTLIDKNGHM